MANRLIALNQQINVQQTIYYEEQIAWKMIQLCVDAYLIGKIDPKINNGLPTFYPGFEYKGNFFEDQTLQESQLRAYVGIDKNLKSIIVCFRGTANVINAFTDIRAVFTKFTTKSGQKYDVHKGFYKDYQTFDKKGLSKKVDQLVNENPGYSLIYTGHSLGGAVANIAALKHKDRSPNLRIKIYTCGQPRVGDKSYAEYCDKQIKQNFRVINQEDRVPHLPYQWLIHDYKHSGFQLWYKYGTYKTFEMFKSDSENGAKRRLFNFRNFSDHSSDEYNLMKTKSTFAKQDIKNAKQ